MTKNENIIFRLKELIAILETNVTVARADLSVGLGAPVRLSVDGATWSRVYKVELEMHKALNDEGGDE